MVIDSHLKTHNRDSSDWPNLELDSKLEKLVGSFVGKGCTGSIRLQVFQVLFIFTMSV
jgi:hypothetical protein